MNEGQMQALFGPHRGDRQPGPLGGLTAGQRIRITQGLLKGAEGQFIRRQNSSRVMASVALKSKVVVVDVPADHVEVI